MSGGSCTREFIIVSGLIPPTV